MKKMFLLIAVLFAFVSTTNAQQKIRFVNNTCAVVSVETHPESAPCTYSPFLVSSIPGSSVRNIVGPTGITEFEFFAVDVWGTLVSIPAIQTTCGFTLQNATVSGPCGALVNVTIDVVWMGGVGVNPHWLVTIY